MTTTCLSCRIELPPREGAGRPSRYCSDTCKRVAGYEITRLNRRLQKLEERLSVEREEKYYNAATKSEDWKMSYGMEGTYRIEALQAEIDIANKRLMELCTDSG